MSIATARRMASYLLKAGESKVRIDPARYAEVAKAVTKDDVRSLIRKGAVSAPQAKGVPRIGARLRAKRKKKGRGRGYGRRRGTANTRNSIKGAWMKRVRSQRSLLRELKDRNVLDKGAYRTAYRKIKGGEFRDKGHMLTYLKERGMMR